VCIGTEQETPTKCPWVCEWTFYRWLYC